MKNNTKYLQQINKVGDNKYIDHISNQFITERKLENFLLAREEERSKATLLKSKPYHLVIEPTNTCNLGCPLCPTGLGEQTRAKGKMKINQFTKLIDEIYETTLEIYFQNWGESTLLAELPNMIEYTSSRGIWTNLSTNFSREYKKGYLKKLMGSGLALLHVDLDGVTQEVYEKYRMKGNLALVLKNIKKSVELKKQLGKEFPYIEVVMLAMRHNEHQFDEFEKLALDLGVDGYSIDKIQVDPNSNSSQHWLPENKEYIYPTYKGLKRNTQCHWPWSGMVINWDGNVAPCCIVDDPKADFGNVSEHGIMGVWNNDFYVSSRAEFGDKRQIKKQTICNICKNETHSSDLQRVGDTFAITL